jgi:hypothetical protein
MFLEKTPTRISQYQLCGKILQGTIRVTTARNIMAYFLNTYGSRARKAQTNEGVDWKAMSHAIRAALQVREILVSGTITFPLKEAEFLTAVKRGTLDFTTVVLPELERLMAQVEELSEKSDLPRHPNTKLFKIFLIETMKERMK